jgi:Aldehyde dehydrogenase family
VPPSDRCGAGSHDQHVLRSRGGRRPRARSCSRPVPDVPTISFTGSTRVGRAISQAGAERLKRFGLELGGKTPMLVFDDADADAALPKLDALDDFLEYKHIVLRPGVVAPGH